MKSSRMSAAVCVFSLFGATAAFADDCSGRDHTAGTVLGAAGGAAIGGVATHNAGGAIAGAVVGGVAGNAIARSQDCNRENYRDTQNSYRRGDNGEYDRRGDGPAVSYYGRGYEVASDEKIIGESSPTMISVPTTATYGPPLTERKNEAP